MKPTPSLRPPRRVALFRVTIVVLACTLVAVAWGASRSTQSTSAPNASVRQQASAASGGRASARIKPSAALKTTNWSYDVVLKRNLFRPPASYRKPAALALPDLEPMPVALTTANGAATGQSGQWTYAGYATVDGDPQAIVENSGTKRAEFVRVGQKLDEYVVRDINARALQLTRAGETTELKISEAFTATPLNEPPKSQQTTVGAGRRGRNNFFGANFGGGFFPGAQPPFQDNSSQAAPAPGVAGTGVQPLPAVGGAVAQEQRRTAGGG